MTGSVLKAAGSQILSFDAVSHSPGLGGHHKAVGDNGSKAGSGEEVWRTEALNV